MRATGQAVVAVLLAILAGGCGGASTSPAASVAATASTATARSTTAPPAAAATALASATAGATAAPTPKPVAAVTGTGFVDSKAFTLKAGNYVVRWTLTSKDAAGCTAIGAIHTPDGATSVEVANTSVKGKASRSGSKSVPKLPAGSYVVTFATTCTWTARVFRA
jgi:hypothetical protein